MRNIIIDGNNFLSIALFRAMSNIKRDNPAMLEEWIIPSTRKLFTQMCKKLQRDFNETSQYYIVWDHPNGSAWRKQLLESYKAGRSHNSHLKEAIAVGKQVADELLILNIEIEDAEADDAIYSLSKVLDGEKIIISRDRDMLQIIQQGFASRLWDPVTKKDVEVPEYDIVLYKCLVGDSSDNIAGIDGVGPTRALKLMSSELPPEIAEQVAKFRKLISMAEHPFHEEHMRKIQEIIEGATYDEIR